MAPYNVIFSNIIITYYFIIVADALLYKLHFNEESGRLVELILTTLV